VLSSSLELESYVQRSLVSEKETERENMLQGRWTLVNSSSVPSSSGTAITLL